MGGSVGYVTIPPSALQQWSTPTSIRYGYYGSMTNLDALAWIKKKYSPPGAPWQVVGQWYAMDPNSSGQNAINPGDRESGGWLSDWRTAKSSLTDNGIKWCHNIWCVVLKKEATATTAAEAMLWAVPFAIGNNEIQHYGTRTLIKVTNALPDIDITANPATTKENNGSTVNAPGQIILTNALANPYTPAFDVTCYAQIVPINARNVSITQAGIEVPQTTDPTSARPFIVHFPAGTATRTLLVRAYDDGLYQPNQTAVVILMGGSQYTFNPNMNSAAVKIAQYTTMPVNPYLVALTDFGKAAGVNQPGSVVETRSPNPMLNTDSLRITANRAVSGAPLAVYYQINGTALPNRYTINPTTGVAYIPIGATSVPITLSAVLDRVAYDPASVTITLLAPWDNSYYTPLPGQGDAKAAIVYDDDDNQVSILTDNATAVRGGANARFRLVRSGANLEPMNVGLTITGTPRNGIDYTPMIPAIASFPEGAREIVCSENMPNDGRYRRAGAVTITANPGLPYRLAPPTAATIIFTDPTPAQSVDINGIVVSGAAKPEDAVTTSLPGGVRVTGGIIALGGGPAPLTTGTQRATVIPDPRYENGAWIPPITPYGIDVRVKTVTTQGQ